MIGKTILNYEIESLIGEGGMGAVYLARHKNLTDQKAAIKVIKADRVNAYTEKSLKEEAENLAHLQHQNIVAFHDYHIDEEGNIYLIMEYVDGMNLAQYIDTVSGLIVQERVLAIFNPVLDGMAYAHKHGVIHRDIKPSNIAIASDGTPKILDFGIATLLKNEDEDGDRLIVGTPQYMSPEQVKGEKLDQRSDIYSLGVLLHQMLTGKAPYDATTMTGHKLDKAIVEEPLPRLKSYYKYTSDKVQKVVDKATAKRPADRYQSCEEFKRAINNAINPPKINRGTIITIVVAAVLLLGGGIFSWLYFRTSIEYYKDYTLNRGVPEGVGEISSFDAKHVHRMYQFEYSKFKLREVKHVNSKGVIIPDGESERAERPIWASYYYDGDGNVSKVKVRNSCGAVLYVQSFNENQTTVIFQYDDEHGTEKTLSSSSDSYSSKFEAVENNGRITRYLIEYDANGYVSKIEFAGFQNIKVCNADGIYAIAYERDAKGRKTKETYLGKDGKPTSTRWGLGVKTFEYDDEDNWVCSKYLTMDGKESFDVQDGISVYRMKYDKYGNMIDARYENQNGELLIAKKYGFAGQHYEYSDEGYITKEEYLGLDGKLMFTSSRYAYYEATTNEYGFFNTTKYYDIDGNLCTSTEGYAEIRDTVDQYGLLLERWFYDENGDLTLNNEGIAGLKCKYDKKGNPISYMVYDIDRKPTLIAGDDVAGYLREFNDLNQLTKLTNLSVDSTPGKDRNGVYSMQYEYDVRGNLLKVTNYDADSKTKVNDNDGVAAVVREYDDNGNITSFTFYDKADKECNASEGYSKIVRTYDENSNITSVRYFNCAGKPVSGSGDASVGCDYKYDEFGNEIENKPVDANGNLAPGKLISRRKYDKYHNEIEFALYNEKGPETNSLGYHRYTAKYDSRNNVTEMRYFDTKGNLTNYNDDKYCIKRMEYDEAGQLVKTSFFNKEDKPELCDEGYAVRENRYDKYGNVECEVYIGKDGGAPDTTKIVPQVYCQYDIYQNRTSMQCRNSAGKPIMFKPLGFCEARNAYDKHRNIISESYYDTKGKPVIHSSKGYFKMECKYDNRDNRLSEAYFNEKNEPMMVDGYASLKNKYDEKGRLTEFSYYDTKGNLVNNGTFARAVFEYEGDSKDASRCVLYNTKGKKVSTLKYVNGEWVSADGGGRTNVSSGSTSGSGNWQSEILELKSACPVEVAEGIILTNASIDGNSVSLTFKLASVSYYSLTDDQISTLDSTFAELKTELRKGLGIPRSIRFTVICVDKAGRQIKAY